MTSVGPDINIGGRALAVIWSLNAISISIVIARCMTQRLISRQLGLSDALVIISMFSCAALRTSKLKRIALWALFWAQFILNIIVVVTLYVQCQDIRALWDSSVISTCCPELSNQNWLRTHSLERLHRSLLNLSPCNNVMESTDKSTDENRCFVGLIMKIVYLGVLDDRGDYTYNTVPFFIWVQVESNLVVIASSSPSSDPFSSASNPASPYAQHRADGPHVRVIGA
ncbi:hypothetical protein DID88_005385 [Monilinia fructigena]|uniref:Uncharacterized protein n=1 Tax=Monilinia fructigena TaxID=38457 RepID=A0A395IZL6_9HELO|nr:hypothetical protein DID88_005385 [Monilinia fructigena]